MRTIFVSSTFADMQFERDILRDVVSPQINNMAREYNDHLEFCDLRWGINTEEIESEAASKKVLDICLDEVDRTNPPMIILLGERYGWIPEEQDVRALAERKQMRLDHLKKSVTALESEYGTIGLGRTALVYFRTIEQEGEDIPDFYKAESAEHKALLNSLKERLETLPNCRVKSYHIRFRNSGPAPEDLKHFSETVTNDLEELLKSDWDKFAKMTPFQREREKQWAFIREKDAMFTARAADADHLMKRITEGDPVTICKGVSGSGKSTLLSHVCMKMQEAGWNVLPFIGGLTDESNDGMDILRNSVYYLEDELALQHFSDVNAQTLSNRAEGSVPTLQMWQSRFTELSYLYEKNGGHLLIAIDAVDQLFPDEIRDNCAFIPSDFSKAIQFFMTSLPTIDFPEKHFYALQSLMTADIKNVITGILKRIGKELSDRVIDQILRKETSDNPYYVSMLVQRLCMMGISDFQQSNESSEAPVIALGNQQIHILEECPDSIEDMCVKLFLDAASLLGGDFLNDAMKYLAVSRYGLRKDDLAAVLGDRWNELTFAHFLNYLYEDFQIRTDGRLDFMHKTVRQGLQKTIREEEAYHQALVLYMETLDSHDPIKMDEYPYHLVCAKDKERFTGYLKKYELGKDADSLVIGRAAKTIKSVCLTDARDWIYDLIVNCHETSYWTALLWFVIKQLDEAFGESLPERMERFTLLKEARKSLAIVDEKGKLTESNKEIFLWKLCQAIMLEYELADDELLAEIGNIYLDLAKKKYGAADDPEHLRNLFLAYYKHLFMHKGSEKADILKEGLEISKEGEALISLIEEKGIEINFIGQYFGCLGELYSRMDDKENCLRTYQKDLKYRMQVYDRNPNPNTEISLAGAYLNVAMAYAMFDGYENKVLEHENYKEAVKSLDHAMPNGAGDYPQEFIVRTYFHAADSYFRLHKDQLVDKNELLEAINWIWKSFEYGRYYLKAKMDPQLLFLHIRTCDRLAGVRIPSDAAEEFLSKIKKDISEDENDASLDVYGNQVESFVALMGYYVAANLIMYSSIIGAYDLAADYCTKGIRIAQLIRDKGIKVSEDRSLNFGEEGPQHWIDVLQRIQIQIKEVKTKEKSFYASEPASGLPPKGHSININSVILSLKKEEQPKLAGSVSEKILHNAIASYASNVTVKDIVAIEGAGGLSRGKEGVLYTKDALYSSYLSTAASIAYSDIRNIAIRGDDLCFYLKNGKSVTVDFGKHQSQVYEIIRRIVNK